MDADFREKKSTRPCDCTREPSPGSPTPSPASETWRQACHALRQPDANLKLQILEEKNPHVHVIALESPSLAPPPALLHQRCGDWHATVLMPDGKSQIASAFDKCVSNHPLYPPRKPIHPRVPTPLSRILNSPDTSKSSYYHFFPILFNLPA
ncbi:hypothetical protein CDAR_10951 [Caerostris darwini]|uniref:Uncharacterized protein n=1 Tax=Caerostris darwini TaxID=1538125 RepID=A0AAV4W791_9ARAC|nr:hypothetical protein CDAR_10951 [Caerostris darwini]